MSENNKKQARKDGPADGRTEYYDVAMTEAVMNIVEFINNEVGDTPLQKAMMSVDCTLPENNGVVVTIVSGRTVKMFVFDRPAPGEPAMTLKTPPRPNVKPAAPKTAASVKTTAAPKTPKK